MAAKCTVMTTLNQPAAGLQSEQDCPLGLAHTSHPETSLIIWGIPFPSSQWKPLFSMTSSFLFLVQYLMLRKHSNTLRDRGICEAYFLNS